MMNNVMTDATKRKLLEFLLQNKVNLYTEQDKTRIFTLHMDLNAYILHKYLKPDEEQLQYAIDNDGFKIYKDYLKDYENAVLDFLELKDIKPEKIELNRSTPNDFASIIIIFSSQRLKQTKKLASFMKFYKQCILETKGTLKYEFEVENRTITFQIKFVEKMLTED